MTKFQWIVHWREERIRQRRIIYELLDYPSKVDLGNALKELYDYQYLPKQQVLITLLHKYKDKLAPEFILSAEKRIESWKPEAKIRAADEMFKFLIYAENPFLKLAKPLEIPGQYFPVPIIYGKKDDSSS